MSFGIHPCHKCKNFIGEDECGPDGFGNCKAFPKGIPYDVFANMKHRDKPENCNNGIGFEPDEELNKPSK